MAKKAKTTKFNLAALKPEKGIELTPTTTEETLMMYAKLDELAVKESFRLPLTLKKDFDNAKHSHKRITKKIFIFRKLDSFNFRCWRVADGTVLKTSRKSKK